MNFSSQRYKANVNHDDRKNDPIDLDALVDSCKSGMKRLAKLTLNDVSSLLGTDWEGYDDA